MADEYTTSFLGDYQGYMEQENKTVQELEEELQQRIIAQSNQSGLKYPSQFMIPGSMIGYLYIKDATITAATIASAAIGRAHIQDLAVDSAKIDVAAIGTAHMQDASIVRAKIQNGEIVNAHIENATITGAKIGGAAIDTAHIKEGAITNLLLGTAVVKTANIEDLSVTDAKILTLTANKLIAGTIDTSLVSVQGPNGKLRLTGNRIQVFDTQAVPVERVAMGDVMGDGTIYGFLVRGADGTTVLMDTNGVKNAGITDGAITNPKIGDNAVNNRNIIADTITGNKLVVDAITAREIAARTITAQEIKTQTILAEHIQSLAGLNVNNQFVVDAAGNVKFSGDLTGANGTFSGRVYGSEIEGSLIKSSDKPNYDDPTFTERAKMEAGKFILESKKTAETVGTILTLSGYGMKVDGPADDRELSYPLEYRDSTQSTEFQNGGILVNPVTGKQPTFFIDTARFGAGDAFIGNPLLDAYYYGTDPNLSTGAAYVRWDAGNFGRIEFNNMFMNIDSIMSIRNADNNDALMTFHSDRIVAHKKIYGNLDGFLTTTNPTTYIQANTNVQITKPGSSATKIPIQASSFDIVASNPYNKTNIYELQDEEINFLIDNTSIFGYMLKVELLDAAYNQKIGTMIQSIPQKLQSADGNGVDIYAEASLGIAGVKMLKRQLQQVIAQKDKQIEDLEFALEQTITEHEARFKVLEEALGIVS